MMIFAAILLDPATAAAWLAIGTAAGWAASKMMGDASYGTIGDLLLGAVGGVIGGLLFGYFKEGAEFFGSVVAALVGACVVVSSARALAARQGE